MNDCAVQIVERRVGRFDNNGCEMVFAATFHISRMRLRERLGFHLFLSS